LAFQRLACWRTWADRHDRLRPIALCYVEWVRVSVTSAEQGQWSEQQGSRAGAPVDVHPLGSGMSCTATTRATSPPCAPCPTRVGSSLARAGQVD